MSNFRKRGL